MELSVDWDVVEELKLREKIGSNAELARRCELSQHTVLSMKYGRKAPDLETVAKLAGGLRTHPYVILKAEGFPDPHQPAQARLIAQVAG